MVTRYLQCGFNSKYKSPVMQKDRFSSKCISKQWLMFLTENLPKRNHTRLERKEIKQKLE